MKFLKTIKRLIKKFKLTFKNLINLKIKLMLVVPICVVAIAIFSIIVFFMSDFLADKKIEARTQNIKSDVALLKSEMSDYKNELKTVMEIRDRYRAAIKEVVDMLYHKDIAMGGTLETIPETDEITLLHLRNVVQSMDNDISLLEEAKNYLLARKEFADNFPFIWPVKLEGAPTINSNFGIRSNKETNTEPLDGYHFHPGIDLGGVAGDSIIATAAGKVIYITETHPIYGKLIIIKHKYEFSTYYAHLKSIRVKLGQTVKRGDIVGLMGNTGKCNGVHLHYEIRAAGVPIDPLTFLSVDY